MAQLQWINNGYLLTLASFILLGGFLAAGCFLDRDGIGLRDFLPLAMMGGADMIQGSRRPVGQHQKQQRADQRACGLGQGHGVEHRVRSPHW